MSAVSGPRWQSRCTRCDTPAEIGSRPAHGMRALCDACAALPPLFPSGGTCADCGLAGSGVVYCRPAKLPLCGLCFELRYTAELGGQRTVDGNPTNNAAPQRANARGHDTRSVSPDASAI